MNLIYFNGSELINIFGDCMPFAKKFRAMMDFPVVGDKLDDFIVEEVNVWDAWDEHDESKQYVYGVKMVLHGKGGKQGVAKALKPLFTKHILTFSGYGNPYQRGLQYLYRKFSKRQLL